MGSHGRLHAGSAIISIEVETLFYSNAPLQAEECCL